MDLSIKALHKHTAKDICGLADHLPISRSTYKEEEGDKYEKAKEAILECRKKCLLVIEVCNSIYYRFPVCLHISSLSKRPFDP